MPGFGSSLLSEIKNFSVEGILFPEAGCQEINSLIREGHPSGKNDFELNGAYLKILF